MIQRSQWSEMFGLVYPELHNLARAVMRWERPGHTLQPTALLHEAYLRLSSSELPEQEGRAFFFGVAGRTMRELLVDHARRRRALKRGGPQAELQDSDGAFELHPERTLALNELLEQLGGFDQRALRIVELRYFMGMSVEETAAALNVSQRTVKRDWEFARAWLERRLSTPCACERAA